MRYLWLANLVVEVGAFIQGLAEVVIACVAIWLAWRANQITSKSALLELKIEMLVEILHKSRSTRDFYFQILGHFPGASPKQELREAFVDSKERVTELLGQLHTLEPGTFNGLQTEWGEVKQNEDTLAIMTPDKEVEKEHVEGCRERYKRVHESFQDSVRDSLGKIKI